MAFLVYLYKFRNRNIKFLTRFFGISLNHRTRRNCSHHNNGASSFYKCKCRHPELSRALSEVVQLISGRSEIRTLSPGYVQLHIIVWDELIAFTPKLPGYSLPIWLFKICFLSFFFLKENSINLLCFHSSCHNHMKYQVPPTVDLWLLMVKLFYKSYKISSLLC